MGLVALTVSAALLAALAPANHLPPDAPETRKIMVLRTYFSDYEEKSLYTNGDIQAIFQDISSLWFNTSYGAIDFSTQVSELIKLPQPRSYYICEPSEEGCTDSSTESRSLVRDDKRKELRDYAVQNSPQGLDWSDLAIVAVLLSETNAAYNYANYGGKCNVKLGPDGLNTFIGCATLNENPQHTRVQAMGHWAHEIGHGIQVYGDGPLHPSNHQSSFELMDGGYPAHVGVFLKQGGKGFPSWLPQAKYQVFTPSGGGGVASIFAREYSPDDRPDMQAVRIEFSESMYYLVSCIRRVLGDDLRPVPDEGVLIERVVEGADQWVTVQGRDDNRRNLWKPGDTFTSTEDGLLITVLPVQGGGLDPDVCWVNVAFLEQSGKPDVMLYPWVSPPGNTWETTDIWVDSPVDGLGFDSTRMWNDASGNPVPIGNGDSPAVGLTNLVYARVRNTGTALAKDVVAHIRIHDPVGVGIAGDNGWVELGTATKDRFPGLASIPAGGFVDVYVEWKPEVDLTDKEVVEGKFHFHTCLSVVLDHVEGETIFDNQDGESEQENIDTFEVPKEGTDSASSDEEGSGDGSMDADEDDRSVSLRNDDEDHERVFHIAYVPNVPPGWNVIVNGGDLDVRLGPGERADLPVVFESDGTGYPGDVYSVEVFASTLHWLPNPDEPSESHPEFRRLGGVTLQYRIVLATALTCTAQGGPDGILVQGRLAAATEPGTVAKPRSVLIVGANGTRFLANVTQLVTVAPDGTFRGSLSAPGAGAADHVACLFDGHGTLGSSGSGFVPVPRTPSLPPIELATPPHIGPPISTGPLPTTGVGELLTPGGKSGATDPTPAPVPGPAWIAAAVGMIGLVALPRRGFGGAGL